MLILAHRGTGKGEGENSISAFKDGLSQGADGIEVDIRITKDEIPVCVHDDTLNRVFKRDISLNDLSLKDIDAMGLLNNRNITTLENLFKQVGVELFYDIEIKDPQVIDELKKQIEFFKPVNLMFSTFRHECIEKLRKYFPDAIIAPLINFKEASDYKKYILSIIEKYKPDALNLDYRFFIENNSEKKEWFRNLKFDYDLEYSFWTVNSDEDFLLIKDICDYLITDTPSNFVK